MVFVILNELSVASVVVWYAVTCCAGFCSCAS